jgi:hypothetical protein
MITVDWLFVLIYMQQQARGFSRVFEGSNLVAQ